MRILETYNFENQTTYGVTGEIKTATLLGSKKIAIANESNVEIFDFDERHHNYFPYDFKQASSSSLQEEQLTSINSENIYLNVGESTDSVNSEEIENGSNNLIKNDSNQSQSNKMIFATLGDIQEMIYCKEGSYLLTLEKFTNFDSDCCGVYNQQDIGERKHSNKDNKTFKVLIYTNILGYFQNSNSKKRPTKEMPLIVPRIASKITPTARISDGIEMIELEVYEPPDMINCCQETGNILVKSNFHLYIFSYRKCLNEQQHFNYIDFFEFPFYLELNFLPKQIALIENVIACINQKQCIVFKILTHEQQRRSTTSGRENVIYSNNTDSIMDCDDIDEDDGNVYSYGTSTTTTTTTTATTTESATTLSYNSNCDDVFYGAGGANNKYGENRDLKNCEDQLNFNMENIKLNKNDNEYDEKCVYRGKKDIDTDSLECVHRNENVKIENFLKTKINLKNNSLNYETLIKNSELNDCKLCSNTDPIQNATNNTENTVNCQLLNEDVKNVTIEDHPIQSTELNVKLIHEKHYNFSYGENNQPCNNSCQKNQDKKYEIKKMLQIRMASLKHSNLVKIPETFTCFDLKAIYKKPAPECGAQANTSTISNNNTDLEKSKRYKNCIGFSFIITTTAADGYLYQFCNNGKWYRENQKPLTKYQFTAQVISIIISDFVVHAITRETIETVTSRIGHKLFSSYYEYPMLSDPFPNESAATTDMQIFCMKLHSFCNIQFVLKTNESLILISKCPIECCINSNISGNTSSCNNSNDALVVNPKLSLSVKNSGNMYSNTVSNQSNAIENSANDREQIFNSNQHDTTRNCSTFEISSNNFNSISDKKDNQKPINPSGSNNGRGGGSGSGVVNLLNGKYFQFNSINKNKNSSKKSNKIINDKLIRQNSLEWTVYNLKMPDAVRLTEDLESSARETLKNGKSIFTKGKNEGNFSPTAAAIPELINSTANIEENEIDNSKNPNSSNNTNSSLSITTATYDLVYELLTEANIILRLAKNLDFNYNDSYISEIDKMFKRNCKFLADTIIQLDKEDQYSEAIGYYRMSETSLQAIYTTYFSNLKLQPNTGLNYINDSNKMVGLTYTMKTYLNCFAKTRADSDFLFEVITPILAQKKNQANNDELMKICTNKLAIPGSFATTHAKTNNYTYDENNSIQFGYELFRYFCIHDKNLLGTLGLKSMPFLDCNINNYLTYLSLSATKSNYNEMLLYSLALSRIKSFEAALVQLEKMSRYQLFLSLKYAWQILFDDNFNPEDCKDETFSEFTERVLFRTKKTELIEAISDVFLFYLCVTNRIEIKFIIELFVNYFALHVENCNNNIKNDKTTSNTNSKESSSTTSSNKNFNINYNNDIPRKIFEIILGGYCQDILSPEISTNENHILPSPINNINNNYLNKPKINKLYCSKSDTVDDKSTIENSEIENRIININHECQLECNNSIVLDIINKTEASTSKTVFEETTHFNLNYDNKFIFMTNEQSPAVKAVIILLRLYLGNLALATKEKHKIAINSNDLKSKENLNSVDNHFDSMDQEILMITRIHYINELINLFEKNKLPRIKWLKRSNLNDNIANSKNINDNISNNNNNDKNNNRNNICSNKTINGNYNIENKNKMINNNNINDNNNNNNINNINNHSVNKPNISMNYIELLPEILPNYDIIQQTNDNNRLKIEFIEAVNNYIRPIVCLNERPSYLNVMKPFKKDHFKNNYFTGHSDEIVMWVLKTQGLLNSVKTNCILYDFLLFIQKNPNLIGVDSFISILLPIDMSIQFLITVYPEALYEFGKCYKITNDDFRSIFRALIAKIRELNSIKSTADKSFEYYQQQIKRYQKILDGILQSLHNDRSFESFLNCLPTEEVSISGRFIIREDTSHKNNNGNKEANPDKSYNENNCQNISTNISAKQYIMDNVDETNLFQIFLRKCVAKQRVEALQAMIESTGKQLFEAAKNSQLNLN